MDRRVFQRIVLSIFVGFGLLGSDCMQASEHEQNQGQQSHTCKQCSRAVAGPWTCSDCEQQQDAAQGTCQTCSGKDAICGECLKAKKSQQASSQRNSRSVAEQSKPAVAQGVCGCYFANDPNVNECGYCGKSREQKGEHQHNDFNSAKCSKCRNSDVVPGRDTCLNCNIDTIGSNNHRQPLESKLSGNVQKCDTCERLFSFDIAQCPVCFPQSPVQYNSSLMRKIRHVGVHMLPALGACMLTQHVQSVLPAALRMGSQRVVLRNSLGVLFGLNMLTIGAKKYFPRTAIDHAMDWVKAGAYATGGYYASGAHRALGFLSALCSLAYRLTLRHQTFSSVTQFLRQRPS